MREGRSGLVHATTGAGKTIAVALGAWLAFSPPPPGPRLRALAASSCGGRSPLELFTHYTVEQKKACKGPGE